MFYVLVHGWSFILATLSIFNHMINKIFSQCKNINKNPIDLKPKIPWKLSKHQQNSIVSFGALGMSQTFRHKISCSSRLPDRIVCPNHNTEQVCSLRAVSRFIFRVKCSKQSFRIKSISSLRFCILGFQVFFL